MGHDVCETMGAGVTVHADFVDSHQFSFGKWPAQCYACWGVLGSHVVVRVLSDILRGRRVPNIVLGPSFCIVMFAECACGGVN